MPSLVVALLMMSASSAIAAKYHWKVHVEGDVKSLSDGESSHKVGDWNCTIGVADLNSFGTETRRLGCSANGVLQAYGWAKCYVDSKGKFKTEPFLMNLQQKSVGSFTVQLICQ